MSIARKTFCRHRWRLIRAHVSMPTLLARFDERRVVPLVAAVDGGIAILLISVAAWLSGVPLIFPSLAPSAFILFTRPFSIAASPRSIVLGHSVAIACGWFAWSSMSFFFGEAISPGDPGLALWLAADLGFALTCILLVSLSCPHPPACGTALVVALGAVTRWDELLVILAAVVCLAFQGVIIHRLLGVHAPLWRTDPRHAHLA